MSRRYFLNLKIVNKFLISFLIMFFLLFLFQLIKNFSHDFVENSEKCKNNSNNFIRIILLIFSPFIFFYVYLFTKNKYILIYFLLFYSSAWSNFFDCLFNENIKDYWFFLKFRFNLEDVILTIITFLVVLNIIFYGYKKFKK